LAFVQFKKKFITKPNAIMKLQDRMEMCEFTVILNGKEVFKDVVYVKTQGNNIIVKDVLGESREFKSCKVTEIDVNATKLVLSSS
jgi:predicted RNA-binding protein